ncbi:MAG: hypothetical protein ACXVXT_07965 [Blastococcus sp.]
MITGFALLACGLLAGLAVFQGALVAGLPLGRFAWGGRQAVLPANLRIGSTVSIVLYAIFALIVLQAAAVTGVLPGEGWVHVAVWVLAGYFLLGTAMNAASRSRSERLVMTPVALLLAACFVIVAIG